MDSPDVSISISHLRNAINAILDGIEERLNIKSIPLEKDYYYFIPNEYKYDMSIDPENYLIGQLADDWSIMMSIVNDNTLATPLSFMHLAPILEYLATQVDWYGSWSSNPLVD